MRYVISNSQIKVASENEYSVFNGSSILKIENNNLIDILEDEKEVKKAIKYFMDNDQMDEIINFISYSCYNKIDLKEKYSYFLFDYLKEKNRLFDINFKSYDTLFHSLFYKYLFNNFKFNNINDSVQEVHYLKSIFRHYFGKVTFIRKENLTQKQIDEVNKLLYDNFSKFFINDLDKENKEFFMKYQFEILLSCTINGIECFKYDNFISSILNINYNLFKEAQHNTNRYYQNKVLDIAINLTKLKKFTVINTSLYNNSVMDRRFLPNLYSDIYYASKDKFVEFLAYDIINTNNFSSVKSKYNKSINNVLYSNETKEKLNNFILNNFPTSKIAKLIIDKQLQK